MDAKAGQNTSQTMSFEDFLKSVGECLHPAWLNSTPERKSWRKTYSEELRMFFADPPETRITPMGMAGALESGLL